jgi:hypothetical protein
MGVVGRLDQYASMLTYEFDETTANNMSITGLGTYYSSEFNENIVDIVRNGLVLNLDAGNLSSYPGSGTTWTDVSGNSNNGTLTNGPTYSSANNGSIVFDGVDDYVNCGTPSISVGKITVNAWVKITTGSLLHHIVDSASNAWHLAILSDNRPYFWNNSTYHTAAPALTVGQWYMLTGVQGTTLDIYINGVLGQSIASNVNVTTNTVNLGRYQSGGRQLTGNIANAQIYNRALTATEIQQNYNALATRYGLTTTNSTAPMSANVFAPYDPVYDEFSGTLFGAGQGRYMRQNTDKSVIVYNEIDEITDFYGRGIVRDGLVLDLDAGISASYAGRNYYITPQTLTNGRTGTTSGGNYTDFTTGGPTDGRFTRWVRNTALTRTDDWDWSIGYTNTGLSVGQILTVSFYARCPNSTLSNITLNSPDSVAINATIDSTWRRYSGTVIYGGDYVSTPFVRINRGNSNAYVNGATYDIAQFQIEKGSVLTDFVDGTIWTDLGVYSNNGTLTNAPTYSSSNGGSIVFDGVDDYTLITNPTTIKNQNFTISTWVNPGIQNSGLVSMIDFDHGAGQGWVLQSEDATTNRYYYFAWHDGTQFQPTGGGGFGAGKGIQLTTSVWQNIVYSKNGTSLIGYLNGSQVYTGTASNGNVNYGSNKNLSIGDWVITGRVFKGNISNTQIYNRALSAAEISQNYNALKGRYGL